MLDDFIASNRDSIIGMVRQRVAQRTEPKATGPELANGIPAFLDQLVTALSLAEHTDRIDHDQIKRSAGRHGFDLLKMGMTIEQVVHDYGDVCQVVTELAIGKGEPMLIAEFRVLNLCLDDAIAAAVAEFTAQSREALSADVVKASEIDFAERLGVLAHEQRNLLATAVMAWEAVQTGKIPVNGTVGSALTRSLLNLCELADRAIGTVRVAAGILNVERLDVAEFVGQIEVDALMLAKARSVRIFVAPVAAGIEVDGDRRLLASAISNLIQNGIKFSPKNSLISLRVQAVGDRVHFEVEDECGGLPPDRVEDLFKPYQQHGSDRTGVGLGLAICMRAARANGGDVTVLDMPGKGCVFTLSLPRAPK